MGTLSRWSGGLLAAVIFFGVLQVWGCGGGDQAGTGTDSTVDTAAAADLVTGAQDAGSRNDEVDGAGRDGCGDGTCEGSESCLTCPADCGCTGCGMECSAGECRITACDGRECGDDGCGGVCGDCPAHHTCAEGLCEYEPWCGDEACDPSEGCTDCPQDCGQCPTEGFVMLKAASFWMGSPDGGKCPEGYLGGGCRGDGDGNSISEPGRGSDEHLHYVTLTRPFEIQRTEVTQTQWIEVFGWNPSFQRYPCSGDCPANRVIWYDALAYANQRSVELGYAPCFEFREVRCNDAAEVGEDYEACMNVTSGGIFHAEISTSADSVYDCEGFRLPTEAEWEYAARAGSTTPFHPGGTSDGEVPEVMPDCDGVVPAADAIGWYCGNSDAHLHPVAQKAPNAWGLYDMTGNVEEWCWDREGKYEAGTPDAPVVDPEGPGEGTLWVLRGGEYDSAWKYCRSAHRSSNGAGFSFVGFRLARTAR